MKRYKLTESQLQRVIKESVNILLNELITPYHLFLMTFNNLSNYLENVGFQCIADYDMQVYLDRNDMPIPFEKKIWDDEGQIIVAVDLYPEGDGTEKIYSAVCKYGHGNYDMDEEEGNSEDLCSIRELQNYLKDNDLERWN